MAKTPRPPSWTAALLAATGVALHAPPLLGQWVEPTFYRVTGVFEESRLIESSGVAVSRNHPGILWTHNDGGDKPNLYVTNLSGEDLGHYRISGADARDWEDIALGPCPDADTTCIYIADTGDNLRRRRAVAIYIMEEPGVLPQPGKRADAHLRAARLEVRYPDGPHDVEALAVAPEGDIFLITKGLRGRVKLFRVPTGAVRDTSVTAVDEGFLDIVPQRMLGRLVTGPPSPRADADWWCARTRRSTSTGEGPTASCGTGARVGSACGSGRARQ